MAGFIRRFSSFPPESVLTAIEGVNIIDLAPPGSISGVGSGVACCVGEFADMTYALEVNETDGTITSDPQPVEIFSARDLSQKLGGFDPTLGAFGGDCGNGYVELRNKRFFRLIAVPINLASGFGIRLWRSLPTNVSATVAEPVVATQAAVVEAGREFRDGVDRIKTAARQVFTNLDPLVTGVDGDLPTAGAAATQTFTSPGSTFITDGVQVGDAVVIGVIDGAGALGSNAGTYRVQEVTSETELEIEAQDGATFAVTADTALPFRVEPASNADTGKQTNLSSQAGCLVPVRPLTDGQGTGSSAADGNWAVDTALAPLSVPAALTATSADPLSGLAGTTGPSGVVDYDAETQAPNAANDATIDALYSTALDSLLQDLSPARDVNIVWCARKSNTIRSLLRAHVASASADGIGRTACLAPELDQVKSTAFNTVIADTAPGVGAQRAERVFYSWPPALTFVPEAAGTLIAEPDGKSYDDGQLTLGGDGFLACVLSNLAPHRNPGESTGTTQNALAGVLGLGRNVPALVRSNYQVMRSKGICGLRIDRTVGPVFQSGVTTSLVAGEKNIARRRMADFIEDSLAQRLVQLAKLPYGDTVIDTATAETDQFLDSLLSADNPAAQQISDYNVDPISGNTPEFEAKGVFVLIVNVRTLASADFITIQANIGEGVVITQTL